MSAAIVFPNRSTSAIVAQSSEQYGPWSPSNTAVTTTRVEKMLRDAIDLPQPDRAQK
jgi:hypothetical protein